MRKKIMIGAGIAAVVMIIALTIILFSSPKGKVIENPDTDSDYFYTFTENRNGLIVSIDNSKEGYIWTISSVDDSVVQASELKSEGSGDTFLLEPKGNGSCCVEFSLQDKEISYVSIYRLYVNLIVTGNEISVLSSSHLEIPEDVSDENNRYIISLTGPSTYLVRMNPVMNANWQAMSENGSITILPYSPWGTMVSADEMDSDGDAEKKTAQDTLTMYTYFELKCVSRESDIVYIYDQDRGEALEIKFEYDESLGMHPVSHAMVSYGEKRSYSSYNESDKTTHPELFSAGIEPKEENPKDNEESSKKTEEKSE